MTNELLDNLCVTNGLRVETYREHRRMAQGYAIWRGANRLSHHRSIDRAINWVRCYVAYIEEHGHCPYDRIQGGNR